MEHFDYSDRYLRLLSQKFRTVQEVSTELINLEAILALPKGTEHFMSDIHGEDEAFAHILNNCSGVVRDKIDAVYGDTLTAGERAELATLIYYPEHKLEYIKAHMTGDLGDWYRVTLRRLSEICRVVASKYTRSKVRKALPADFAYIIDELLNTDPGVKNKENYYNRIITSIIEINRADAFITAIAGVIKRLAVDRLHIIGDVFDRGPRPDHIMDMLMHHHSVDIQWGNHDMLWMGAACGSEACIFNILGISVKYSNMEMLERGYGISLRHLTNFAQKTYADGGCFAPKVISAMDREISGTDSIARLIEREIDVATIKRLLSINRGEATISEVEIPKNYSRNGTSLMDFNLPNECVIVSITRGDSLIIPRGNTQIFSGDKLIVICRNEYLHQLLHALRIE